MQPFTYLTIRIESNSSKPFANTDLTLFKQGKTYFAEAGLFWLGEEVQAASFAKRYAKRGVRTVLARRTVTCP